MKITSYISAGLRRPWVASAVSAVAFVGLLLTTRRAGSIAGLLGLSWACWRGWAINSSRLPTAETKLRHLTTSSLVTYDDGATARGVTGKSEWTLDRWGRVTWRELTTQDKLS